jgi:DNA-binding response OmpR family regulator
MSPRSHLRAGSLWPIPTAQSIFSGSSRAGGVGRAQLCGLFSCPDVRSADHGGAHLTTGGTWRPRTGGHVAGAHRDTSAVLLSPHQAVAVRLHALELGFDDAVDLSADPMEVVGRLSIAGRRGPVSGTFPEDRIPVGEGVELDRRARAIRRDGRLASLRPRELALLEFLAMHPGRAFSREELIKYVWHGVGANERVVDVYVYWLRAKIELDPASPTHLVTVRGSGYLFDPPENTSGLPTATRSNVNEPPTSR